MFIRLEGYDVYVEHVPDISWPKVSWGPDLSVDLPFRPAAARWAPARASWTVGGASPGLNVDSGYTG